MISCRQLVKDAISHKTTDRVPYDIMFCPDSIEAMKRVVGEVDFDKYINNDVAHISIPWWGWHELGDDWRGFDIPTSRAKVIGTGPSYQEVFDNIQRIRDEEDKYILVTIWGSHWEKANFSRGIENFLADMAGEPEFAQKVLDMIIDKNMVMLENVLDNNDIDGILLGSDWGTQLDLIMSPDTWDKMIRPGEQREYDLVHDYGKDVWIHSCGKIDKIMGRLVEMGVDVLNPIQPECMDLTELKEKYGSDMTFWGGISTQQTLPYGTPEEVTQESREVRDLLSKNGGYILGPSQGIQDDVPVENMLALLEVAKNG